MILKRDFFEQNTVNAAKSLVGCKLVKKFNSNLTKEYLIVEVEAYRQGDDASHSCSGKTKRNFVMFGPGGKIYVYLCYGMYYMLNFSAEKEGVAGAILIRALEPLSNDDIKIVTKKNYLTNGPGKLTKFLDINRDYNNKDLCCEHSDIYVLNKSKKFNIVSAKRIGIKTATDKLWRFYIKGNKFVSKT